MKPGNHPREWLDYQGSYLVGPVRASVFIRNGTLFVSFPHLSARPPIRLTEYRPGLFYTPSCDAVRFRRDQMSFADIPGIKES